jgi:hypothetical protein
VKDADVTLHAYMSGIGSIEGVAQLNDELRPTPDGPRHILYLEPKDGGPGGSMQRITSTDGSFRFVNLTPGSYFFWAGPMNPVHAACGGIVVDQDHPLHISERQQVKGCTVVVGGAGSNSVEKP